MIQPATLRECDVAIIGAGPAGLGCAIEASRAGLSVLVLDEQLLPGSQATDWDARDGAPLVAEFRASTSLYWPGSAVWQIEQRPSREGFVVYFSQSGLTRCVTARHLVIATGALERPVPIPGCTLPGVMNIGAAQTLLKIGAAGPVVIAGQGPLLMLYALQLLKSGIKPLVFLQTTPAGIFGRALAHVAGALASPRQILKALRLMADIHAAGVPFIRNVESIEAVGTEKLSSVRYSHRGKTQELAADLLLLHEGMVPHTHLAMSLGVMHHWDANQLCWHPDRDEMGRTSVDGVRIAGDAAGIGGWPMAEIDGRLIGSTLAKARVTADPRRRNTWQKQRRRHARLRSFLDAWYRPRAALLAPADEVIVCRCENKSAGALRLAIHQGCVGPNQVKAFTRCGMGTCQGRDCALTLTTLLAAERKIAPGEAGYLRIRPPLKPLTLGELASLEAADRL